MIFQQHPTFPPNLPPHFLLPLFLTFLTFLPSVLGLPSFPARIPNGEAAKQQGSGITCLFLGHKNCVPGAPRNAFGTDFSDAGYAWTQSLCEKDSDGDGLTNGQELGDPCCQWSKDKPTPLRVKNLSHPGDPSSVNIAAKSCPTSVQSPSPSASPTSKPPTTAKVCGDVFSRKVQPVCVVAYSRKRVKVHRGVLLSVMVFVRRMRLDVVVSVVSNKYVRRRVLRAVTTQISGVRVRTNLAKRKRNRVTHFTQRCPTPLNKMPVPPGRPSCCGPMNKLPTVITVSYCNVMGRALKNCQSFRFTGRAEIRCRAVCGSWKKKHSRRKVVPMGPNKKCPSCM